MAEEMEIILGAESGITLFLASSNFMFSSAPSYPVWEPGSHGTLAWRRGNELSLGFSGY